MRALYYRHGRRFQHPRCAIANANAGTRRGLEGLVPVPDAHLISIVDDDPSARLAIARLVRSLGWHAHSFASAAEFLNSLRLHDTSCALIDAQMPRLDGLALQRRLLALKIFVPVIFMTALPDDIVRARALSAGAVCFLTKPLHGPALVECIDAALLRWNRVCPR